MCKTHCVLLLYSWKRNCMHPFYFFPQIMFNFPLGKTKQEICWCAWNECHLQGIMPWNWCVARWLLYFWTNPKGVLLSFLAFCYICSSGVESKFNVGVEKFEWIEHENFWSLTGLDGQNLGHFKGVVASDKNIVSPRFIEIGRPTPLGMFISACACYFITLISFYMTLDIV